ncbi:hypothetical protein CHARACLAT_021318 [Characodon lateralis]|uniref:Uncharacterized protein n=1 Tax=Characodon lateralis TaxID=208331 RepID=A0ABU7DT03_9TELE|nr:hypothetical protein [Characodon lateralis]
MDHNERTLSTLPHNNIISRTSELPQSESKYLPAPFISVCSSIVVSPPSGRSKSTPYFLPVPAPLPFTCSL